MTSPSPTRRRTTRPRSIPEQGSGRAAVRLALTTIVVVVPVIAAAGWRDLQRSEPPRKPPAPAADVAVEPLTVEPDDDATAATVVTVVTEVQPVADESPADPAPVASGTGGPCGEEAEDCRDALTTLRSDSLSDIDMDIRVGGEPGRDYPCECRLEGETFQPRRFATTTFTWKAAGYCHKPLYFEHWNLERYGHSHGFVADSFLSAAHFFGRLPALPYQMGVELPWECVYPLGYYRPGSCAPWTVPAVPVSARGFAVGAATATGIVFLLP
jgi:hypothetical protein